MTALYKVLEHDGASRVGVGKWPLPNGKAGEWLQVDGLLVPCKNGLHLCRRDDLVHWLGPAIFVAEYEGEVIEGGNEIVVRRARLLEKLDTWTDRTARLFAADCAERVLHIYERDYPNDSRVRNAIEIARKFANGELPISVLGAARNAAWAAFRAADGAAAAAGTAASLGAAFWTAARAAAWAAFLAADGAAFGTAARNAAWAAFRAADGAAEREWQTARLFEYLEGTAQ